MATAAKPAVVAGGTSGPRYDVSVVQPPPAAATQSPVRHGAASDPQTPTAASASSSERQPPAKRQRTGSQASDSDEKRVDSSGGAAGGDAKSLTVQNTTTSKSPRASQTTPKSPRTPKTPKTPKTPQMRRRGTQSTPSVTVGKSGGTGSHTTPRTPRTPRATPRTPRTPRNKTPAATPLDQQFIVAVVEFRNRQTVGVAAMSLMRPELLLWQFSDNQTYTNTLMLLNSFEPQEILVPDTALNSPLCAVLRNEFELVHIEAVRRKFFNEEMGKLLLEKHGLKGSLAGAELDGSKYLCLAGAAALIKYIEFIQDINFAPNALNIRFRSLAGHMKLDVETVRNLELVYNLQSNRGGGSLFQAMNSCKTNGGARLLRASILQPYNDLPTIKSRLAAVEELTGREDVFFDLVHALPQFVDLDHLSAVLIQHPKKPTVKTHQSAIINLLLLKRTMELIPGVADICAKCESDMLRTITTALKKPTAGTILDKIHKVMDPDASITRKNAVQQRAQLAFAVRMGISGMLDVSRQTYAETSKELHELAQKYREQTGSMEIRLTYTVSRGHHLIVPAGVLGLPGIGRSFVQPVKKGKRVFCTTEEVLSLNERQNEAFAEICMHTGRVVEQVLVSVREHINFLYSVSESLSYLDLLLSFANLVSLNDGYIKPDFTTDGPIAIKLGRHPVVEMSNRDFVPNSTYLNTMAHLQVVTGPNNSGKSTYLRQTAVLTVMAHIGCFVPATFASFKIVDQIFTRMSTNDDAENQSSTFTTEMKETAYILKNATEKSLVLLDELGRGTSSIDGVGLAWATAEGMRRRLPSLPQRTCCAELLRRKCYTLLATHFLELTDLNTFYPSVKNVSLAVQYEGAGMKYLFKLTDGPTSEKDKDYGIHMASVAAMPADVIDSAKEIADRLRERLRKKQADSGHISTSQYSELVQQIRSLKHSPLTLPAIKRFLAGLVRAIAHYPSSDRELACLQDPTKRVPILSPRNPRVNQAIPPAPSAPATASNAPVSSAVVPTPRGVDRNQFDAKLGAAAASQAAVEPTAPRASVSAVARQAFRFTPVEQTPAPEIPVATVSGSATNGAKALPPPPSVPLPAPAAPNAFAGGLRQRSVGLQSAVAPASSTGFAGGLQQRSVSGLQQSAVAPAPAQVASRMPRPPTRAAPSPSLQQLLISGGYDPLPPSQ